MRERVNIMIDVAILTVGLLLTGWFYHELYLTFQIPWLAL